MNKPLALTDVLCTLRDSQSPQWRSLYDVMVQRLVEERATEITLKVGDSFPDFTLASAEGQFVSLQAMLARGPAVLSFYRGRWCPYCSAELESLNAVAEQIRGMGAVLAAITAEAGGEAIRTKFERSFDFEILCDLDNGLALECGIVFKLPTDVQNALAKANIDFPKLYGNTSWFLPIPATYIVDRSGIIREAYVNADFRFRLDPAEIVRALQQIES
jgi:peroxiredoxin